MSRPRTAQELIHLLETGAGARWITVAAALVLMVVLSLRVAWTQFRGPASEMVMVQADVGRQLAKGQGFTTLVNYPQAAAFFDKRGVKFDPARAYPEVYEAPFYSVVIAAGLRVLPAKLSARLFDHVPAPPDGFGGDYFLLGLNVGLLWLAAALTFVLARRLFDARTAWVAVCGLIVTSVLWQQVVAVNGVALMMVLALAAFWILAKLEDAEGGAARLSVPWLIVLGVTGGLLFLTEYSAAALALAMIVHVALRFTGARRWLAAGCVVAGFAVVAAPWVARNLSLTGSPVALAVQNVALKYGDSTAEPATVRATLSPTMPEVDLNKLGNKVLSTLQEDVRTRVWSGGLWFTAFFAAGWLYAFRSAAANRLRWTFTIAFGATLVVQACFNSGETDRLAAYWMAPLILVFGAGFFFVLLASSPVLGERPRLAAAALIALQAVPLTHDVLEPRRLHFNYPPYFPVLFVGVRDYLKDRDADAQHFGLMADVPAGTAWYSGRRVWAQPAQIRDFYALMAEEQMGALLLTPRTLDRPFFSELASQTKKLSDYVAGLQTDTRPASWGEVYGGIFTGQMPANFPLKPQRLNAPNLYLLLNPAMPPARGK